VATISLRRLARDLGFPGDVSVCRNLLGYEGGRVPGRLDPNRPQPRLSLRDYAATLSGPHFDMTLILAGADTMTANDTAVIDFAVHRTREIFATAGVGVRLVRRDERAAAASWGHDTISTSTEIDQASRGLTVDGGTVPVVFPAFMSVTDAEGLNIIGRSPISGQCGDRDPQAAEGLNSAVVAINGEDTGRTVAHEVGHFLGCEHPATASTTLMTQTGKVTSGDAYDAITIDPGDLQKMRDSCPMLPAVTNSGHDIKRYAATDYSIEDLTSAARGNSTIMAPGLAIRLLEEHPDTDTKMTLSGLLQDPDCDLRSRRFAAARLKRLPQGEPLLRELSRSSDNQLSALAGEALAQPID
jgi:hypothetical protein